MRPDISMEAIRRRYNATSTTLNEFEGRKPRLVREGDGDHAAEHRYAWSITTSMPPETLPSAPAADRAYVLGCVAPLDRHRAR
jgi:hypothetical protein